MGEYSKLYNNPRMLIWSSLSRAQIIFRGNTCVVICQHFHCFLITNTFCLPPLSSLACGHLTQRNISHTTNDPALHILSPSLRQDILSYKISFFDIKNKTCIFTPQPKDHIPPVCAGIASCKTTILPLIYGFASFAVSQM